MNGDFASEKGIVGYSTGTFICKVAFPRPILIQNSVWSIHLSFAEMLHVAMINTAEWEINRTRHIDRRWDIFHGIGQCSQLGLPNLEPVVSFARGWNLLKRWICTGHDCTPAEHCQRKHAVEGTNDHHIDKNF